MRSARSGASRRASGKIAYPPPVLTFPLLLHPERYRPCDWDLRADDGARAYWLDLFDEQLPTLEAAALASGYGRSAIDAAAARIRASVERLRSDPFALCDSLDILALDKMRDDALRNAGIDDPCRSVKERETQAALRALPARLDRLDALDDDARWLEIIRSVFAGNLFDLGAPATADQFASATPPDFSALLSRTPHRPWLIDDFDAMTPAGKRKAILFADNAGADAALGLLPLARALHRAGCEPILAANEAPALNDITADELRDVVACAADLGLREAHAFRVISTGSREPLLDLSRVSSDLCAAAEDADLLVFLGMGRALESNWRAAFSCEAWRLAVIKDPAIAARRSGRLFDCVCSRAAAGRAPPPPILARSWTQPRPQSG